MKSSLLSITEKKTNSKKALNHLNEFLFNFDLK